MNASQVVAAVEAHMRGQGVTVLARPSDTPPADRGWALVYGPALWDDTEERAVCGDFLLEHGEVTVMCAGHNRAEAQWVADKAMLLRGQSIAGSAPLYRVPSRGVTPEDETGTVWSAPVILSITA